MCSVVIPLSHGLSRAVGRRRLSASATSKPSLDVSTSSGISLVSNNYHRSAPLTIPAYKLTNRMLDSWQWHLVGWCQRALTGE